MATLCALFSFSLHACMKDRARTFFATCFFSEMEDLHSTVCLLLALGSWDPNAYVYRRCYKCSDCTTLCGRCKPCLDKKGERIRKQACYARTACKHMSWVLRRPVHCSLHSTAETDTTTETGNNSTVDTPLKYLTQVQCAWCDKVYQSADALRKHARKRHLAKLRKAAPKCYVRNS